MISLVIPVYNEVDAVADTVARAKEILATTGEPFEIVVVDDGSDDGSDGVLRSLEGVTVVVHPHNVGYGRALKSGITAARYETIAIVDADGTYPLDQLPGLLSTYRRKGLDMIVGARTGINYRESALKAPLRALLKFIVEYTAGRRIPDINSGLRIFERKTTLRYFRHLSDRFSFTTSLTLSYMMNGHFVAYQDIPYGARVGRTKVRLFRDSLRTLQNIVQAAVYYNPLKMFILLAAACIGFSGVCFLVAIILGLRIGYLLGIGGILMSMLITALGFLAILLKQIMDR
jgi:glycosyltransferase involved in cell wall biosynthesis